jgi:hypothetical protein
VCLLCVSPLVSSHTWTPSFVPSRDGPSLFSRTDRTRHTTSFLLACDVNGENK